MTTPFDFFSRYTAFLESGAKEYFHRRFNEPHEVTFYMEHNDTYGLLMCFDVYDQYSSQDGLTMRTLKFTPAEFTEFIGEDNE